MSVNLSLLACAGWQLEGKPWGYYDRSVLAVTVMSLQKALATIESLKSRITALESK
jgi:hypothetical protein